MQSERLRNLSAAVVCVIAFVALFGLIIAAGLVMDPTDVTGPPRP